MIQKKSGTDIYIRAYSRQIGRCFDCYQVPITVQGVQEMTKATTWMIDIFRAFIAVLLTVNLVNDCYTRV